MRRRAWQNWCRLMQRWTWQIVFVVFAAVLSLYVAFLVNAFYSAAPSSSYEPKDFQRQRLMEEQGRSTIEAPNEP